MTKPFIILIDLDNVIADQTQGFYNALAAEYPQIQLPARETLKEFNIEKNFDYDHEKTIKAVRLKEGFFRNLPIISGAKEGLEKLRGAAAHVRIVTAPTWEWQHCVREKYEWIEANLGRDWTSNTILTRDKTFIRGDILIDDNPSVAGIWAQEWTHILYDQPYNRNVDMPRVSWDTMDAFIEEWITKHNNK